jgi:glycosyltransferase involved in cell wall biosynthesis
MGYSTAKFIGEEHVNLQDVYSRARLGYQSLLGLGVLIPLVKAALHEKPTQIWVNQIGGRVPWSAIWVLRLFGFRVLFTAHDFMSIHPVKLTPGILPFESHLKIPSGERNSFTHSVYVRLRSKLIRFYLNFGVTVVAISEMQAKILEKSGLKVNAIIPNGIGACACRFKLEKIPMSILFCGRLNSKGLNEVITGIRDSKQKFHLFLAGDDDLLLFTASRLSPGDYTFLGKLSNSELTEFMHQIEFVAVISQYYDNFPTTILEAIIHGAIPITTSLTGNSKLVSKASNDLVLKPGEIPDFSRIRKLDLSYRVKELKSGISNESEMIQKYLSLMQLPNSR